MQDEAGLPNQTEAGRPFLNRASAKNVNELYEEDRTTVKSFDHTPRNKRQAIACETCYFGIPSEDSFLGFECLGYRMMICKPGYYRNPIGYRSDKEGHFLDQA